MMKKADRPSDGWHERAGPTAGEYQRGDPFQRRAVSHDRALRRTFGLKRLLTEPRICKTMSSLYSPEPLRWLDSTIAEEDEEES